MTPSTERTVRYFTWLCLCPAPDRSIASAISATRGAARNDACGALALRCVQKAQAVTAKPDAGQQHRR